MGTPRASRTSALPARLEAARFPCLATATPAPATTKAAAVEMLNVPAPSPPVPQTSMITSRRGRTWTEAARRPSMSPRTSSTVSPLARRPMRNAPACAGVAFPSRSTAIAALASSRDRERRLARSWRQAVNAVAPPLIRRPPSRCGGSSGEGSSHPGSRSIRGGTGRRTSGVRGGGAP